MTLDAYEISDYEGTPEQLFLFVMGNIQWGYVNSTSPVLHNTVVYQPMMIELPNIVQSLSENSPTIDIKIDGSAEMVQQFVPYQPIFPIRVRVYRHHIDDADDEFNVELIGEIVSAQFDEEDGSCNLSVRMVASNLDRKVPWPVYQKPCNWALYGPGCRVNKALFKTEATVTDIVENQIVSSAFEAKAIAEGDPKWFRNGYVVRVLTGETRFVIDQEGDVLFLQAPFVGLQENDDVEAFAGCDRLIETCTNKFGNRDRFSGFPWPPEKNPFTDNVYGTGTAAGGGAASGGGAAAPNTGTGG